MKASDLLTRDEIHALTRRSNWRGALAVAGTWAGVAAIFAGAAWLAHPVAFMAAAVLLGGRQHALAVLMHEAAHGMLFRHAWLNHGVGQWLCAYPVWTDLERYRKHHLGHHAHTGTAADPDLVLTEPFPCTRRALARKIMRDVLGISGVRRIIGQLLMDFELREYSASELALPIRLSSPWMHLRTGLRRLAPVAAMNGLLLAVLAAAGHAELFWAWALAYLTWFGLFLRLRAIAEHAGTAVSPDIFVNTRTTYASVAARWFLAPHNVNYHVEHHLLPTMPMHNLPRAHQLLRERGALAAGSVAHGYAAVFDRVSSRP
jgi:fatty acid desaturase